MYNRLKNLIETGNFDLNGMTARLQNLEMRGEIDIDERDMLIEAARRKADPMHGSDLGVRVSDHEARIRRLEALVTQLQGGGAGSGDGETAVTLKPAYDPYKWYYTGDGCSWEGKNYTCVDSPDTHPCTWSPAGNPNRWTLDAQQPE